jgi:DegV family protein with EDD domain
MPRVRIVTDSTSDVPEALIERLGIVVVPAYVQMAERSFKDREEISRTDFYRRLPDLPQIPTTAAPPAYEFATAFRSLVGQADEVIAILVSSNLSGMRNSAYVGRQEVAELPIHLVDSGQVTMGLGWQVILAAEAAAAGKGAPEILRLLEALQPRIRILAMLDTLEYLHRSGRVAWAQATAARFLRIKPLIEVHQGQVLMLGRVRTRSRAVERLIELTAELGPVERLAVVHTEAPDVDVFRERLATQFSLPQILISEVGPIVGAHVGTRALGIAAVIAA